MHSVPEHLEMCFFLFSIFLFLCKLKFSAPLQHRFVVYSHVDTFFGTSILRGFSHPHLAARFPCMGTSSEGHNTGGLYKARTKVHASSVLEQGQHTKPQMRSKQCQRNISSPNNKHTRQ